MSSNINGANIKDFLINTLTILNDELTDNETINSIFNRICFRQCFKKFKIYFVNEIFLSTRIYIGTILHLVELVILMSTVEKSSPSYLYGFSLSICVCFLILTTTLVIYDVFLVKRINKGKYRKDFDSCFKTKSKYKSLFKLSVLFLVLFKIVSLLASIDIFTNTLSDINEDGLNYFDRFFFAYGICDFCLSVFGIIFMLIKLFIDYIATHIVYTSNGACLLTWNLKNTDSQIFFVNRIYGNAILPMYREIKEEEKHLHEATNEHYAWVVTAFFANLFNSQFLMVTFVVIGGRYLSEKVLPVVLVLLISILILSCILLIISLVFLSKSRKFNRDENFPIARKHLNWAKRFNFFSDLCNVFFILGLCITIALALANLYSCKECYSSVLRFKNCCNNNKYCFQEDAVHLNLDCDYYLKFNVTDEIIQSIRRNV